MAEIYLFTGKGGAGKTTCAAAFARALERRGRKVLLASLDPAHNLGDVLDLPLGPEPRKAGPGIRALEADLEGTAAERIRRARRLMERNYRYLSAGSLDPLLSVLGKAPGLEEQAASEVLWELREESREREEVLVVDLPPSGQAWRILSLPSLNLRWARSLLELRRKILDRRKTLRHVLGEETPARDPEGRPLPEEEGEDPVAVSLGRILERNRALAELLADPRRALVAAVALPSRLSLWETERLERRLGEWGIPLAALILNRADPPGREAWREMGGREPDLVLAEFPREPRGAQGLVPLAGILERLLSL